VGSRLLANLPFASFEAALTFSSQANKIMIRSDGYPNLTVDTRSIILHLDLVSTLECVHPRVHALPGNLTPRAERFSLIIYY